MRVADLAAIEAFKTIRRRAFWITLVSFGLLIAAQFATQWYLRGRIARQRPTFGPVPQPPSIALPQSWPHIFGATLTLGGVFVAIAIVLLIADEFEWRTARQN